MKINDDSIARLDKLKMDANQMKDFASQFEKILEYFSRLLALDTKGVLPLVTPFETFHNLREVEVQDFKSFADDVLKSSDFKKDRLFVVPPVVGGE